MNNKPINEFGFRSIWRIKQIEEGGIHRGRNVTYTMMAKPIGALELRYPMIQFLIINSLHSQNSQNNC